MDTATRIITLKLPEPIYERYKEQAEHSRRSVEDELLEVVSEAAPAKGLAPELAKEITTMSLLSDKALWKVARSRMPAKALTQLRQLNHKQQKEGRASLTQEETQILNQLGEEYDRYLVLRSHAVMLLKKRGFDVSKFFEG
jgi:hypothetical protein